jgi:hypothetical protein
MMIEGQRQAAAANDGERIAELIELIDALIEVVREENIALAMGLPASQSRHTELKSRLAEYFEIWVGEVSARRVKLTTADAALQASFATRIECLRHSMDENVLRLRAAIDASQRRIEAVMAAIRAQISDVSPYGASGRIAQPAASCGTSIRA